MAGGRPPLGVRLVDRQGGSEEAKLRLKVIIETLNGERTIPSACQVLDIGESAFHKLRERFIQESVQGLERRAGGRKRKEPTAEERRIAELEGRVKKLERDLEASQIREDLALLMPHVLEPRPPKKGSNGGR